MTASFYQRPMNSEIDDIDEINMYYDCKYISACEVVWQIFGFDIHYRYLPVERLSFHLPNEQSILFSDDDPIDSVVNKHGVKKTRFLAWMEANKKIS